MSSHVNSQWSNVCLLFFSRIFIPILAYNFDDLDRDQPNILVSFAMPVCHVMQTHTLIVKASKTFQNKLSLDALGGLVFIQFIARRRMILVQ